MWIAGVSSCLGTHEWITGVSSCLMISRARCCMHKARLDREILCMDLCASLAWKSDLRITSEDA